MARQRQSSQPDTQEASTPGPWEVWTSCSWRRIGSHAGKMVCEPITQRSDNHPDLYFPNGGANGPDARLICAAPELLDTVRAFVDWIDGPERSDAHLSVEFQDIIEQARTVLASVMGGVV